jgi:Dyp-type peroxidase family
MEARDVAAVSLELDDIQAGALYERPSPYVGTYLLLRIADRADGRELVRRLHRVANPAGRAETPDETSITVAFTYHGLEALGVPQASLDSFAPEFREGMAARAEILGDTGESGPDQWEEPLGTADVHVAIAVLSSDEDRLRAVAERAREAHADLPGVELIWRQDCYQLATGRTSFGFKDGIGQPAVEGSGRQSTNPRQPPLKAGEIILGYPDETGELPPMPTPDVLGRNGTYVVFRKLHTKVAAYRTYLRAQAASRAEEDLLGAKMVGRWQSGAPLALAPDQDDPELGSNPGRNNDFGFRDDPRGFKCPVGAHARRANPRDALDQEGSVDVRLHRMVRRGTSYGPMLPDGVIEDDGIDRGIVFVFAGAHLKRQFEFVKTQWLNDGIFIGAPLESDPLVGPRGDNPSGDDPRGFTIPQRPIRRRLHDLPPFVVTRGGEYCFAPSLSALLWIAKLDT